MACWVKFSSVGAPQSLMGLFNSAGSSRHDLTLDTNLYAHTFDGTTAGNAQHVGVPTTGVWYHACGVWAAVNARAVYLDGAGKVTNTVNLPTVPVDTFSVGRRSLMTPERYFDGDLAEAAIWSVALSDEEVAALGKGVSPRVIRPTSLVAYYPVRGDASPERDRWRTGYHLTVTGATPSAHRSVIEPSGWQLCETSPYAPLTGSATVTVTSAVALRAGARCRGAGTVAALTSTSALFFNTTDPRVYLTVDGIMRGHNPSDPQARILEASLHIDDFLNEEPNRCAFSVVGFVPAVGMRVIVALSGIDNPDRLFAGRIVQVDQGYLIDETHQIYHVRCVDDTWLLNQRLVTGRYVGQSATTIVQALMATYAPEFDLSAVAAGLPVIDEITFTMRQLTEALTQIARRVGASWYVDEWQRLHVFLTEASASPEDLTPAHPSFRDLRVSRDITQLVTRVLVEGGGSNTSTEVAPSETILPVTDATWYRDTGGEVLVGPQRLTYMSRSLGGGGTVVGPGAGPSTAPVATAAAGTGIESGVHHYAVTFVTPAGESTPGPSVSVTTGLVTPPTSPPTLTLAAGPGPDDGTHQYAVTFLTAAGETTASPLSAVVTTTTVPSAVAPSQFVNGPNGTLADLTPGYSYSYACAYSLGVSADDHSQETIIETGGIATITAQDSLDDGTGVRSSQVWFEAAYTTHPQARWLHVYRRNNTTGGTNLTDFRLLASVPNVTGAGTRFFIDASSDASLAGNHAPIASNTALVRTVSLSAIPVGPAATTSRRLYRTAAGGSQLQLLTTLANNTATTYTDTTTDAGLGGNVPTTNTAANNQVGLSSLPIGPTAVTARRIYRTAIGSTEFKLLAMLADNSTTTLTDSASDTTLGASAPSLDLSELAQPDGSVLAGTTTLIVPSSGAFRASGGWAVIGNGEQVIRYTGLTAVSLTGIPASGYGAIVATIGYNSTVTDAPVLTGIPTSGPGAIVGTIPKGETVNLLVTVDDLAAQALLAALVGGTGVQEAVLQDRRLSQTEATHRGRALLSLHAAIEVTARYTCRDRRSRAGRLVTISLPPPTNVSATLRIQSVQISRFDLPTDPTYQVEASTHRYTYEQLLQQAQSREAS
jgi:hypothetical protein